MTAQRYVLKQFTPFFFGALLFFAFIVQLADLFSSLINLIQADVPLSTIATIQGLFMPRAIVYGLPIASVFAASYVLGTLQVRYELLAMSALGLSLGSIIRSLMIFAFLAGIAAVGIQELVAVPALQQRENLMDEALARANPYSQARVELYDKASKIVYKARYYNHETTTLHELILIFRDEDGSITSLVEAKKAVWNATTWDLMEARVIEFSPDVENPSFFYHDSLTMDAVNIEPDLFMNAIIPFDSMTFSEALAAIQQKERTGVPYQKELTKLYERITFGFTPLVVTFLAIGTGRRIRKHVILMSLLLSLGLAVLYYVFQLTAGLLAGMGAMPPLVGALLSVLVFLLGGAILMATSQNA